MSRIVTLTCRKLLEAAPEDTAGCKTCHPCNSKQLNKRITFLWGEGGGKQSVAKLYKPVVFDPIR